MVADDVLKDIPCCGIRREYGPNKHFNIEIEEEWSTVACVLKVKSRVTSVQRDDCLITSKSSPERLSSILGDSI